MKPSYIIIHHAAAPINQTFASINAYHKTKFNFISSMGFYIGYQYLIEGDGKTTQGRRDDEPGAHTSQQNMNYQSIGICLTGWFDPGHDASPTEAQKRSLTTLLKQKMAQWSIPRANIKFHRDFAPKTCPGQLITQDFITNLLGQGEGVDMYDKGTTLEALEPGNFYETPDTGSKVTNNYGKGDQGEVDSVLANPKPGEMVSSGAWIVLASGGVKYGWVEKNKFKAVPRGGYGGYEKLTADNKTLTKDLAATKAELEFWKSNQDESTLQIVKIKKVLAGEI